MSEPRNNGDEAASLAVENQLANKLRSQIQQQGPMTLHDYMQACLADSEFGYYIARQPFGTVGDFITAPDVSQIFGELLGLWCVQVWSDLGQPDNCQLIELGPGRGALMSDALRAASLVPQFLQSVEVHLIETSAALRAVQEQRLEKEARDQGRTLPQLFWHDRLEEVPPGPVFLLANEFLDALPIRQYQLLKGEWFERLVGLDEAGGFIMLPADKPCLDVGAVSSAQSRAVEGDIVEVCLAGKGVIEQIAQRATRHPIAALLIDYGYVKPAFGDSFQAVRNHQFTDPLSAPGLADVTAHVDFSSLVQSAKSGGLTTAGPVPQRDFLIALGARERAAQLMQAQSKLDLAQQFMGGLQRLIDPDQMGGLFKVVALTGAAQPPVPGFEQIEDFPQSDLEG